METNLSGTQRVAQAMPHALGAAPHAMKGQTHDEALSIFDRINLLRFPLVVSVVLFHSESGGNYRRSIGHGVVRSVIDFLSEGMGSIRMPALFLIAGYVFFLGVRPRSRWYARKLKSRHRSVMLPHIAWTTIVVALIGLAHTLPMASTLFSGDSVWSASMSTYGPVDWLLTYFGDFEHLYVYQLWFTRDLFLLCIASPAIYLAVLHGREQTLVAVMLLWLWGITLPLPISPLALTFFTIGACLAVNRHSMFFADLIGPTALVLWLAYQFYDAWVDPPLGPTRARILVALGVIAALYATRLLARLQRLSACLAHTARYSFFLFLLHEPTLTVVRKLMLRLSPGMPAEAAYFVCPAITIGLVVAVFEAMHRVCPRLLSILNGGRVARRDDGSHATSNL